MTTTPNPASRDTAKGERKRIPMSVPVQKLATPTIPGYHLHWFNGTPERLQRALDGGYEYVDNKEMGLNPVGLGSDTTHSGNTDMGSRVSVVAGTEVDRGGQAVRLVLMKIKQEWWEADQASVDDRSEKTIQSLGLGMIGADKDKAGDAQHRYVDKSKTKIPDMFIRKPRK